MKLILIIKEYENSTDSYAVTRRENCHNETDKIVFDLALKWGEARVENVSGYRMGD